MPYSPPPGLPANLTGATQPTRYVGGTAFGAPVSGSFAVGDFTIDQTSRIWICTAAGSPGTWGLVGSGGLFNVKDYGATGDGTTDDSAAIAAAITAASATGGVVFFPPPTVAYYIASGLSVTANQRVVLSGPAKITFPASVTALTIHQGAGSSVGVTVQDLWFEAQSATGTTCVQVTDSDRVILRNLRLRFAGIGINLAPSSQWVEETAIEDTFIDTCTTGLQFTPGGTTSFMETYISNLGVSYCQLGISIQGGQLWRSVFLGTTVWPASGATGIYVNGDMTGCVIEVAFDNVAGGSPTAWSIGTGATALDLAHFWSTFGGSGWTTINNPSALPFAYHIGRYVITSGNGDYLYGKTEGDTAARLKLSGWYGGGGGMSFGPGGSTSPDINLYRQSALLLQTNADFVPRSVAPSGVTGATAASGYRGATASGAPASGTFAVGDWITDQTGKRWTCTVAGSPGTWTQEPGTGGGSGSRTFSVFLGG